MLFTCTLYKLQTYLEKQVKYNLFEKCSNPMFSILFWKKNDITFIKRSSKTSLKGNVLCGSDQNDLNP